MSSSNYLVYRGELILQELKGEYMRITKSYQSQLLSKSDSEAIEAIKQRMIDVEKGIELIKMGKY